jgi:hypothetical protein
VNPNPIVSPDPATLVAQLSDEHTGAGTVEAAEWSLGDSPAPAGGGTAMSGAFGSLTVDVTSILDTSGFLPGLRKLWVRGQDDQGNWGPAAAFEVQVNAPSLVDAAGGVPGVTFLAQSAPNPSAASTTIAFGLPRPGTITLDVFDPRGRLVKRLAQGPHGAGVHRTSWDGRDASGTRVSAGVYFYRLITPEGRFEKRMALL